MDLSFVGRFHPLLVHLPIGLVFFVTILASLPKHKQQGFEPAWDLSLLLSSVFALFSCISGYLLSKSGDYDAQVLFKHQWTGILICVTLTTAYFWKNQRRTLSYVSGALVLIAGHWGGTLTHGEGFLFEINDSIKPSINSKQSVLHQNPILHPDSLQNTIPMNSGVSFAEDIVPILKAKCYSCHSASKKKGGLRLDNESFILAGGRNGKVLKKGFSPTKSKLYAYLILPSHDEKHMPPRGKKQLNNQELEKIHHWIQLGAQFSERSVREHHISLDEPKVELNTTLVKETGRRSKLIQSNQNNSLQIISAAKKEVLEDLITRGINISRSSYGENAISVSLLNQSVTKDFNLAFLEKCSNQIVELDLTGLSLGKIGGLNALPRMPNLRILKLGKAGLNDEGIFGIHNFKNLEFLNLYGNPITDKSIEEISKFNYLKRIYLWNTFISEKGIAALKSKIKQTEIIGNNLNLKHTDTTKK